MNPLSKLQPVSKYKPIWIQLKLKGTCTIVSPPIYHRVIAKMVRRTRDRDIAFRHQLAEANLLHEITVKSAGSQLTFKLTKTSTLRGLL